MEYLAIIYITHASKFVKCFTNRVLHFNTTTTSRNEGEHATLKKHLGTSTGDLKTVVDGIELLLNNQYHNHKLNLDQAKMRYPFELNKPVFREIRAYVTPHAIRKIDAQYELLVDLTTAVPACTGTFTASTGLPCNHKIQERLYEAKGCVLLEDVHPHWWFDRVASFENIEHLNPLLLVQEPEVVRPRGRPPGAENISRRQEAFENSTARQPSEFERVLMETTADEETIAPEIQQVIERADSTPRRGRGSRGGRGRGGARGLATKTLKKNGCQIDDKGRDYNNQSLSKRRVQISYGKS